MILSFSFSIPSQSFSSPRHYSSSSFASSPHSFSFRYPSFHTAMRRRRFSSSTRLRSSAAAEDSLIPSQEREEDKGGPDGQRENPDLQTLLRRFWKVAAPYWSSDDKVEARLKLAAVFALTLGTTGISVGFNFLGRDFYNALANKDQEQFTKQLLYYLGAFAGGIPVFVLKDYARETLSLRWRSWMTSYYMQRYFKNQTFYKIQSQSIIDNPDQRIVDDLSSFTGTAISFSLTLFNAAVDLISFSNILYGIYPPLFVILLIYSLGGTAISVFLGKGLVSLNFMQEKKEADFRYGLVRVRENAESIAFYSGEGSEMQLLLQRFRTAFENLSQLLISSRNLEFFTSGYRYLIQILPAAVVAPMYFSGKIEFGVINQSVSAFNHILGDFSLIVYQFQAISAFSAVIDRLGEFDDVLDSSNSSDLSDPMQDISVLYSHVRNPSSLQSNGSVPLDECHKILEIENLTLQTPKSKRTLISDLSLELYSQDHLLVTGPSGTGKTSLLRAMGGLWSTGKGKITFYMKDAEDPQLVLSPNMALLEPTNVLKADGELKGFKYKRTKGIFFFLKGHIWFWEHFVSNCFILHGAKVHFPIWRTPNLLECRSSMPSIKNIACYKPFACANCWVKGYDDDEPFASSLPFLLQVPNSDVGKESDKPTVDDLIRVLEEVRLGDIISRFNGLDSIYEWSSVLSLGEQQRLAFARLLLSKPKLVLLDESTSALDEANEVHLYKLIKSAGITYISIGHRGTLYNYHSRILRISKLDSGSGSQRNWHLDSINQSSTYEPSQPTL